VWVTPPASGQNDVTVRYVRDGEVPITPDPGEVAAAATYLETLRPLGADVTVEAPVLDALDPEIALTPDDAATRAAVEAEIDDLLRREMSPGGTLLLSHLRAAISAATGETDHTLVSPVADRATAANALLVRGAVTWS